MRAVFSALIFRPALALADQASGAHGAVATASPEASQAALDVLKHGGTAADAAIAATLVLAVTEPQSSGLGGGGFALIYDAKKKEIRALDFRERAPVLAHQKLYTRDGKVQPELAQTGALAVGTPGEIAGLYALHQKYGKRPMGELFDEAIRLASKGFAVSSRLGGAFEYRAGELAHFDSTKSAWMKNGKLPQSGDKWLQPDLAKALKLIQQKGEQAFYKGDLAKKIATTVTNYGGVLALTDLAEYQVRWLDAVSTTYRGYQIYSMPPPSSGGVVLGEMLNVMEQVDVAKLGYRSPETIHYAIEAMRRAYADRAAYLGDPQFVSVPVAGLMNKEYAKQMFTGIKPQAASTSAEVKPGRPEGATEPTHTTHLSVVDGEGNAVVLTTTVNGPFGSSLVADGTGIMLNNEMDDFAIAPGVANQFGLIGGDANAVNPRKTPLSSMTPTLILKDGQLRYGLGSPGGPTIITTAFWMVLGLLDYHTDLATAVAMPRVHQQWQPDKVLVERFGLDVTTAKALEAMGYALDYSPTWGNAQAVGIVEGKRVSASDPRGEGRALAY